jgi:hypothetical protein
MNGKNTNQQIHPVKTMQKVNNKRETSPRSLRVFNGLFTTRVDITRLRLLNQPNIKKNNYQRIVFLLYPLTIKAVIKQTCITLLDV